MVRLPSWASIRKSILFGSSSIFCSLVLVGASPFQFGPSPKQAWSRVVCSPKSSLKLSYPSIHDAADYTAHFFYHFCSRGLFIQFGPHDEHVQNSFRFHLCRSFVPCPWPPFFSLV